MDLEKRYYPYNDYDDDNGLTPGQRAGIGTF